MSRQHTTLWALVWAGLLFAETTRAACPKPSLCKDAAGGKNSISDYAQLASDVYTDDKAALKDTLTCAELVAKGGSPAPRAIKNKSGLYAQVTEQNGQVIIVFRGTEPPKLEDWVSNFMQGILGHAPQYDEALQYADAVREYVETCRPTAELVAVGHSLAGGLTSRVALTYGIPGFTFNPAALADFDGRAEMEAAGPCIQNFVSTGDIMRNLVNPLTDAVHTLGGPQPGTRPIGDTTDIVAGNWNRQHLNFDGKITQKQIDAFIRLTDEMARLHTAIDGWHPIDTMNSVGDLIRTWHADWPDTKELFNEMARQWLTPEEFAAYAANLRDLENSFVQLATDYNSNQGLISKTKSVTRDAMNVLSQSLTMNDQLLFSEMVTHHGMPEMLTKLQEECDRQNGIDPGNGNNGGNSTGTGTGTGSGTDNHVPGGCFGLLPVTDGRPANFLDLLGEWVDKKGDGLQDGLDTAGEAVGILETLSDLAKDLNLGNAAGLGKYAGPLGNLLNILSIGGQLTEVSARCTIALTSGNKADFVAAINDGLRYAVTTVVEMIGQSGGAGLGGVGGTLGGPLGTILGGFVGGWLGGELAGLAGEWLYDDFLADWVKNDIAAKLFDVLCPENTAGGGTNQGNGNQGNGSQGSDGTGNNGSSTGNSDDTDLPPANPTPTQSGIPTTSSGGQAPPQVNPDLTKGYNRKPVYRKLSR